LLYEDLVKVAATGYTQFYKRPTTAQIDPDLRKEAKG
jgi:hypothetical protein